MTNPRYLLSLPSPTNSRSPTHQKIDTDIIHSNTQNYLIHEFIFKSLKNAKHRFYYMLRGTHLKASSSTTKLVPNTLRF